MQSPVQYWMNLESLAEVEVTSEDELHPIDFAFTPGNGGGWKAAHPGRQTIRVVFDAPQDLKLIHLEFTEEEHARTQEFVLRWANDRDEAPKEIVRQQYNFTAASGEVENYDVDLKKVKYLELEITPSITGGGYASLAALRLL